MPDTTGTSFAVMNVRWKYKVLLIIIIGRNIRLDVGVPPMYIRDPNHSSGQRMFAKARQLNMMAVTRAHE
jgi:hypothetical protein